MLNGLRWRGLKPAGDPAGVVGFVVTLWSQCAETRPADDSAGVVVNNRPADDSAGVVVNNNFKPSNYYGRKD